MPRIVAGSEKMRKSGSEILEQRERRRNDKCRLRNADCEPGEARSDLSHAIFAL